MGKEGGLILFCYMALSFIALHCSVEFLLRNMFVYLKKLFHTRTFFLFTLLIVVMQLLYMTSVDENGKFYSIWMIYIPL